MKEHCVSISEQQIQSVLKELIDPNTQKDYVSSQSVGQIEIDKNNVSLEIELGYPAKSVRDEIHKNIIKALNKIPDIGNIQLNITSKVIPHSVQRGVKLIPGVKNVIAVASGKGGCWQICYSR